MRLTRVGFPATLVVLIAVAVALSLWGQWMAGKPTTFGVAPPAVAALAADAGVAHAPSSEKPIEPQTSEVAAEPAIDASVSGASAPDLPVQLRFRRSPSTHLAEGSAVNTSTDPITVEVTILSRASKRSAKMRLDIQPSAGFVFGGDDGLLIEAGDTITLSNSSYREQVVDVPEF
jgi:hypothetical protein